MLDKSIFEIELISVHVKALRTLAPPAATAGNESACALILAQLNKLHEHYDIRSIAP